MTSEQLNTVTGKLRAALSEELLTGLAVQTGFLQRLREVTPYRLLVSMLGVLSSRRIETLADILRSFNALTGAGVSYKPFHNQLAKPSFPLFMRVVFRSMLARLVERVLEPVLDGALGQFEDIVIQDGTSFAVKDTLREVFPGRFTAIRPAAVELHATMSLFRDQVLRVSLAPDAQGERDFLPKPDALARKLLIADRGYADIDYATSVADANGSFILRFKSDVNPTIVAARVNGDARPKLKGQRLRDAKRSFKRKPADLEVMWWRGGREVRMRLVLVWSDKDRQYMLLATNLDVALFDASTVRTLYRLRWQVELLFKEWKSYANLHAFPTGKTGIAEGLIWASLCAALLKRFIAHSAQLVFHGLEVSTRRAAMTLGDHLPLVLRALLRRQPIGRPFYELLEHLSVNARRAHPNRDRRRGRLQAGILPVGPVSQTLLKN